jgi:hypothetical protein
MTARRLVSVLCLPLCVAIVAGCGVGGDTLSFDPVANAASKTVDYQSARVDFSATVNVEGVGGMAFSGAGIFDGRTRTGALNMRFQFPADVQAQLGGAQPTMQMIMDGRHGLVMYMRSPIFRALSDKWIRLDMQKLMKQQGVDLSSIMSADQADPSQSLRMLMVSSDAHPIGYDRVRGVFTTHYNLNIDLGKLAKANPSLGKMYDMLRRLTGVTSYPAEAWIDDQGRVRRLKIDMSFNVPTGGAIQMSMAEELYAFGVKVNIQPPDPSDVFDASALVGSGG